MMPKEMHIKRFDKGMICFFKDRNFKTIIHIKAIKKGAILSEPLSFMR